MADAVSHDQNFKNLIVEYPRQALEFFAPGEAPEPDDEARFDPVRQELLKERLGGRFRALDTPMRVEWADGRRAAVVFALEEESDRYRFSPHRLAHYCLDLAAMLKTDRVVPVVIFLRNAGRAPASLALGTERRAYLTFEYVACKLAEVPGEDWMDSRNLVARVNLPNMGGYQARRIPRTRRRCAACSSWSPTPAGGRSTSTSSTPTPISTTMSVGATGSCTHRRARPWQECSRRHARKACSRA